MARYLCALLLGVDEIEEMAFIARMSAVWVSVIDTAQGVLEGRLWLPRGVDRTTVSALLNEIEFFFEQFENVAIVISHFINLQFSLAQLRRLLIQLLSVSMAFGVQSPCRVTLPPNLQQNSRPAKQTWENLLRLLRKSAQDLRAFEKRYFRVL